jgi:Flp pilus assembly protein CpaB
MKRRRTILLLFLVLVIGAGAILLYMNQKGLLGGGAQAQATPEIRYINVVVAGQQIKRASLITAEQLSSYQLPEDKLVEGMITDPNEVVGKLARYQFEQGIPITRAMLADSILQIAQGGSEAANLIPPGMTAVSVPISRLTSVAYAVRDGDRVNLIVSLLFVDLDPNTQTVLPNSSGIVTFDPALSLTASVTAGGPVGRVEVEPTLQKPFYILPGEIQRPRMASQMILQDIQVLHVGSFSLPDQETAVALQATPVPDGQQAVTPVPTEKPDIITLVVTPQDAVTLTYLVNYGANLTFTLRGTDDQSRVETEAATLQFLLSQYGIPVPAKLPYGITPRLDVITPILLPNDIIVQK